MSDFNSKLYGICVDISQGRLGWFLGKQGRDAVSALIDEYNDKITQCRALQQKLKAVKPTEGLEAELKLKQKEVQGLVQSNKDTANQLHELKLKYDSTLGTYKATLEDQKVELEQALKTLEELKTAHEDNSKLQEKLEKSSAEFMVEQAKRLEAEDNLLKSSQEVNQLALEVHSRDDFLAQTKTELEQAQLAACQATAENQDLAVRTVTAEGQLSEALAQNLEVKTKVLKAIRDIEGVVSY